MKKYYQSKDWLRLRYTVQKKTIYEIADECGCSIGTIQKHLEKFNLIRDGRKWK